MHPRVPTLLAALFLVTAAFTANAAPPVINEFVVDHIGTATHETRRAMMELAVENLLCALRGERPPALHALSKTQNVIHIGSFSQSSAPALRVGLHANADQIVGAQHVESL